jgi:hypothetical protein
MRAFLAQMVPTQLRAIARARFTGEPTRIEWWRKGARTTIVTCGRELKGLEHVEMEWTSKSSVADVEWLKFDGVIYALSRLKLKSMRFACSMIVKWEYDEPLAVAPGLAEMLEYVQSEQEKIMHVVPPPVGNAA